MARINRSDIIQKAVNDLAISTTTDKIPNETLDKVQITYDLNRKFSNFLVSNGTGTSGTMTTTMPTIDTRGEIYLTGITFALIKDATCDIATGLITIKVTPENQGIAKDIMIFPVITLTAQQYNAEFSLPYPLKLKPNTNISVTGTFSLGVMQRSCCAVGFISTSN